MTYAGIQMFMDKLKQLINCNDNPLFNNPSIICERPKFQLLYNKLGSMIQTLFIYQHQDLHDIPKVDDLKKRFTDAAEEAQYIGDLFLSGVHLRNHGDFLTFEHFNRSLNLDDVMRTFKSVEMEFMSMRIDSMEVDSSQRPERTLKQPDLTPSPIYISRNLLGSKKSLDEIFVGHDHDIELIRDKLVQDQKKLDVVSIVGMGGIDKTTLATKVFNDPFVVYHFHVRVWVTVSQTYDKRSLMIQILESIRAQLDLKKASAQLDLEKASAELDLEKANAEPDLEKASDSRLREMVHKQLKGKRYLIVMDDLWHVETWDNIKLFFPNGYNGSRILLTSRLTEVAKHANSNGFIHHLGYLNKEKSWELLCQKVFHDNECPEWSIKPSMQIVENCQGLPLAVVVIAGVLSKEAWSKWFWEKIAEKTGSYIVGEQNGCLETLGLSYNHLPLHLRECFLYLGGFPEDYKFEVQRLIWLWMAEGFIKQDGNRSLEDIAKGYLMYLIDINLVIAADRKKFDGVVKACKVHDLVRELCIRKAKEEHFNILQTERLILSSQFSSFITPPHKPIRIFMNNDIDILEFAHPSTQNLRSILCFSDFRSLSDDIAKYFRSFVLLRVLDLQKCRLNDLPKGMELLVHLRYFAIWTSSAGFPSSICNLWSLQTLIYITSNFRVLLPSKISDLVNLRHLWSFNLSGERVSFFLPSIEKPMNLHTISGVVFGDGVENFQNYFPCIKELRCPNYVDDFKSLTYLEKLKLIGFPRRRISTVHDSPKVCVKNRITFPETLKTLTLVDCRLPWRDMSIIQSIPNLQVLKLHRWAFEGSRWNTDGQKFPQLKLLRLEKLDIKLWETYSTSFLCLRQLEIIECRNLEEIPLEIGDIPTLDLIQIRRCRQSVGESVRRIEEEQHDLGNYDLKINVSDTIYLY